MTLVKEVVITSPTSTVTVDGLDIMADGGVYDVLIHAYINTVADFFLRFNNNTTAKYNTFRTFARANLSANGEGSAPLPYFNKDQDKIIIGDGYGRLQYEGTLTLLKETDGGNDNYVPRIQGKCSCAEITRQSIVNSIGYFSQSVSNITSLNFLFNGNITSGVIRVYKR